VCPVWLLSVLVRWKKVCIHQTHHRPGRITPALCSYLHPENRLRERGREGLSVGLRLDAGGLSGDGGDGAEVTIAT